MSILDRLIPYAPVPLIDDGASNQRIVGLTDEGLEINVPCLPYEYWLDADGNVVPVVISTNRCPPKKLDTSPRREASLNFDANYRDYIREEAAGKKWLPIEEHLIPSASGPPGEKYPGARAFVEGEMARRRAQCQERGRHYEAMARTQGETMAKAIVEGNAKMIDKLVDGMAEAIRAERG